MQLQVPSSIVKQRSREVTALVESFTDVHDALVGTLQRVCVVDTAADGVSLVAHTSCHVQASDGLQHHCAAAQLAMTIATPAVEQAKVLTWETWCRTQGRC